MLKLGLDLKAHASEIERLWREVIAEPPLRMPPEHDLGALPEIIHDLIEVSFLCPHDVSAHEEKVAAALQHGEMRRNAALEERILWEEFAALREALRRYLGACDIPRWKAREALMRLDMAISVAELAAVRGYNREMYEKLGKWEGLTREMAKLSPLLGLPEP